MALNKATVPDLRVCQGEFVDSKGLTKIYFVQDKNNRHYNEVRLFYNGQIESAYKTESAGTDTIAIDEYSFNNKRAYEAYQLISKAIKGCTSKNGSPAPYEKGTMMVHTFTRAKTQYNTYMFNGDFIGVDITYSDGTLRLEYFTNNISIAPLPYVKLTKENPKDLLDSGADDEIRVRSVAEIALEKESVEWLKKKKYYIVKDDAEAEKIFSFLDSYNGIIAYDTETTGLKINIFSKFNGEYAKKLEVYNKEHPGEEIYADKLVGFIFCVQPDVSYYFPVANRKFKNLYEDKDSEIRKRTVEKIKSRYTIGDMRDAEGDVARYIRETSIHDWPCDLIAMERIRDILTTKNIGGHHCSFDWKVNYIYDIDTNFTDDSMILHQLMYKFRSTTSNRGEPSGLKYLSKRELGIDQWDLKDFFPDYKEDNTGLIRGKSSGKSRSSKTSSKIDFSYMTEEGARVYAPCDGDATLQLILKYKKDMVENHREQEYLYQVEMLVACAIGYMEFYGHRLDEDQISTVRDITKVKSIMTESELRQLPTVNFASAKEVELYKKLKSSLADYEAHEKEYSTIQKRDLANKMVDTVNELRTVIDTDEVHPLNMAAPGQVATLFYDVLKYPMPSSGRTVSKKEIKGLTKMYDSEGKPQYPAVNLYMEYKKLDTLLTKFFDNLTYFMFPGGFIFSSFGQISTATGRMSCNKPNAQQYPHSVTRIVKPRDGYVMADADYSQIEYRVLTALAGNEWLAELFSNPDSDYHTLMASLMYGVDYAAVTGDMRSAAKSFNFGIPYGMGFRSLAILLTGNSSPSSVDEAKEKYELYFKNQPKTRVFFDNVKEQAEVNKYTRTFWNRYRYYSFTEPDGTINNARRAASLRQAGNACIQGTAADIFKISVARNFNFIRQNHLLGDVLIINMVHDEQLFEFNTRKLNIKKVIAEIGKNMQFKVNGFPPLFIGAGFGDSWDSAKSKTAEVHPMLLDKWTSEASTENLFTSNYDSKSPENSLTPSEWLKWAKDEVYEFRVKKVRDYILDPENHNKIIAPVIGNLLNLQFKYGIDKGNMKDDEYTKLLLAEFIKRNDLSGKVDLAWFLTQSDTATVDDADVDDGYEDDEDDESIDEPIEYGNTDFSVIDESDKRFGISLQDLISTFGMFVNKKMHVCGIDSRNLHYKQRDALCDFLYDHVCDPNNSQDYLEVVFLMEGRILNHTGVYVSGIDGSEVETRLKRYDASRKQA